MPIRGLVAASRSPRYCSHMHAVATATRSYADALARLPAGALAVPLAAFWCEQADGGCSRHEARRAIHYHIFLFLYLVDPNDHHTGHPFFLACDGFIIAGMDMQ